MFSGLRQEPFFVGATDVDKVVKLRLHCPGGLQFQVEDRLFREGIFHLCEPRVAGLVFCRGLKAKRGKGKGQEDISPEVV